MGPAKMLKEKRLYKKAVREFLIEKEGMSRMDANASIKRYCLDGRLRDFPEIQLHYSIKATVEEMKEGNCLVTAKPSYT